MKKKVLNTIKKLEKENALIARAIVLGICPECGGILERYFVETVFGVLGHYSMLFS